MIFTVSLRFRLKGEDFVVTAEQTIDPREVIYDFEKKILSVASKQGVNLPENNKKYLISRICKALIVQYPIKGEKEPLELEPLEIGEK